MGPTAKSLDMVGCGPEPSFLCLSVSLEFSMVFAGFCFSFHFGGMLSLLVVNH